MIMILTYTYTELRMERHSVEPQKSIRINIPVSTTTSKLFKIVLNSIYIHTETWTRVVMSGYKVHAFHLKVSRLL